MSEASFFKKLEQKEQEITPRYRLMVTRHAERLPD